MTAASLPILLFLGLVFLGSAASKLADRERFAAAVEGYGLVSPSLVKPLSWLLPITEAATGIACLGGIGFGAGVAVLLLMLFSAAVAWNVVGGRTGECGCLGGVRPEPMSWSVIARNAALVSLAVMAIIAHGGGGFESAWLSVGGLTEGVSATLAAVSGLIVFLLMIELRSFPVADRGIRSA